MTGSVPDSFAGPLPREGIGAEAAYAEVLARVVPYTMGNDHARFWGWYMGTGTPVGNLADLVASALNPNLGGGDHAPVLVEQQVVRWCAEAVGYPTSASCLLVSGASEANLVGLAVARSAVLGPTVRTEGLAGVWTVAVYASSEVHSCHRKSCELLGLGEASLRLLPVHEDQTLDVAALAQREGLWLHVDGAIGGFLGLSAHRDLVRGMARADSLALDLHTWMQAPMDVGLVLVRDEAAHRATFSVVPAYLRHATRGLAAGDVWFTEYGIDLTRGFRALRVWMALLAHGADAHGAVMDRTTALAYRLAELVDGHPALERLAPVGCDIVCLRYRVDGLDEEQLDAVNRELVLLVQESGVAVVTETTLRGRLAVRVAIGNHRTRPEDLDLFVAALERLGPRAVAIVTG
ncbi:pyridoxal phosphate-dependent decarboxylase family protein [Phycicoccus jejuensis]|uniref:pyridoxal phosphate-dependent decarboxylase family protein n=1 Tax=Phycicoccus jejuensis TaxID=367299 RepID=UPI00068F89A8|nr:pyridoxal-dependent decarboxylase [Phycicoccus jejuensis]